MCGALPFPGGVIDKTTGSVFQQNRISSGTRTDLVLQNKYLKNTNKSNSELLNKNMLEWNS